MIQNQTLKKASSHPLSRVIRPFFERKKIKSALGGLFSMTSLASGLFFLQGDTTLIEASFTPVTEEMIIETKHGISSVVPAMTGISQEYHQAHPGIDITAPLGSKILPLMKGTVSLVATTGSGYGRWVEVDHGEKLVSRYAHMGKIQIEEGETVEVDTVLGEVGLTGWTTGPHVHMELMQNGRQINPRAHLLSLPKNPRK